jgi:hypothetical protein
MRQGRSWPLWEMEVEGAPSPVVCLKMSLAEVVSSHGSSVLSHEARPVPEVPPGLGGC